MILKLKNIDDKLLYDSLLKKFSKLRAIYGSKRSKQSIINVDLFKKYCEIEKEKFDIKNFFENNYNVFGFGSKYSKSNFEIKNTIVTYDKISNSKKIIG